MDNNKQLVEFVSFITPDGIEYPIFGGRRSLLSWEGMGMPPVRYLEERGVFQNGVTVRDYRVDQRTITVQQFERGLCRDDFYCSVGNLVEAIRPNRDSQRRAGELLVVLKNGAQRKIKARYYDGIRGDWGQSSTLDSDMLESITFYCEEPFWDDVETQIVSAGVVDVGACLAFCLPVCVGTDVINAEVKLVYTGTWDGDRLTILITGPANAPTVTNLTTGQQIKLNYNVSLGETILIEIDPQTQRIVSSINGVLPVGIIESVSDLVSFYLATRGNLTADGTNVMQITASGGVAGETSVEIEYTIRHWSLFAPCFSEPFPQPLFFAPFSTNANDTIIPLPPFVETGVVISNDPVTGKDGLEADPPPTLELAYNLPNVIQNKWTVVMFVRFISTPLVGIQTVFQTDSGFRVNESVGFYSVIGFNLQAAPVNLLGQFVAMVYDRGLLHFYTDGVLRSSTATSGNLSINTFSVGCEIGGGNEALAYIRNLAIFDKVLTPSQIQRLAEDSTPFLP
jgi:hypothetical protein